MTRCRAALTSKLDLDDLQERIKVKSSEADDAFQIFRWMQIEERADSEELRQAKADARKKLQELNDELNRYLASEYDVDSTDAKSFKSWRESHQPFHWLAEFYDIVQGGGFDTIIGNPPYIEIARAKLPYSVSNFTSKDSGNLYCPMMERGVALSNTTAGRFGMIVPMSIVSTERMTSARDVLEDSCGKLWLSHFSGDANPSKLFEGVKFRLSIILASMSEEKATWSSAYSKWFAAERDVLFRSFNTNRLRLLSDIWDLSPSWDRLLSARF